MSLTEGDALALGSFMCVPVTPRVVADVRCLAGSVLVDCVCSTHVSSSSGIISSLGGAAPAGAGLGEPHPCSEPPELFPWFFAPSKMQGNEPCSFHSTQLPFSLL